MREAGNLPSPDCIEGVFHSVDVDLGTVPLVWVPAGTLLIKGVFPYQRQIRIKRDTNPIIARDLECCASVVGPEHWLQIVFLDERL